MHARTLIALLAASSMLAGCSQEEPPAETTSGSLGDSLKNAAEEVGDAAKKAVDDTKTAVEDGVNEVKQAAEQTAEDLKKEVSDSVGFDTLKAKAVAQAEDQMTEVQAQLDGLRAKLDKAAAPVKAAAQPLLGSAQQKLDAVGPKIDALKAAGEDTWEQAAEALTSAIAGVQQSVAAAASKLGG